MTTETQAERAVFRVAPCGTAWIITGPGLENAGGLACSFDRVDAENTRHLLTLAVRAAVGLPPVAPDDEPDAMFRLRLAAVRELAEAMGRMLKSPTGLPLCHTCGRLKSQHTNPEAHGFDEPRRPQSDITAEATARALARNPITPPVAVGEERP